MPRPALSAPSFTTRRPIKKGSSSIPARLVLRLSPEANASSSIPQPNLTSKAARAALSAAIASATAEVGLAAADVKVVGVVPVMMEEVRLPPPPELATQDDRKRRRRLMQGAAGAAPAAAPSPAPAAGAASPAPASAPSPTPLPPPPRPGTVNATVGLAVSQLSRTEGRRQGGNETTTSSDPAAATEAAALLWSPAFVAGVKRAMGAAGFPVDVSLVRGVTGEEASVEAATPAPTPFTKMKGVSAAGFGSGATSGTKLSPAAKAATAGVLGSMAGLLVLGLAGFAVVRARRASRDRLRSDDGGGEAGQAAPKARADWGTAVVVRPTEPSAATLGCVSEAEGEGRAVGGTSPPAWASDPTVAAVLAGSVSTPGRPGVRDAVADEAVSVGAAVAGRYIVLQRLGRRTFAARGLGPDGSGGGKLAAVVLKFFATSSAAAADREVGLLGALAVAGPASASVAPLVMDLPANTPGILARCLVIARGQFTLEDWLASRRGGGGGGGGKQQQQAQPATAFTAAALLSAVARLHARGVVHRLLAPRRFAWFEGDGEARAGGGGQATGKGGGQWRVTGASAAVRGGEAAKPVAVLRYAAPEVVRNIAEHEAVIPAPATSSSDAWAVGAMLYELWTGRALWGAEVADGGVVAGLMEEGGAPPGFEEGLAGIGDDRVRTVIQGLLQWDPSARLSVAAALAAPVFSGVVVG